MLSFILHFWSKDIAEQVRNDGVVHRRAGWRQEVGMTARWAEIQVRKSVEAVEVTDTVSTAGSTRGRSQSTQHTSCATGASAGEQEYW